MADFKRFDVASQITAPGMPSSDMYHVGSTVTIPIAAFNDLPAYVVASLTNFFNVSISDTPDTPSDVVPTMGIAVGGLNVNPATMAYPGSAYIAWDKDNVNSQNAEVGTVPVSFSSDGKTVTFSYTGTYCVNFSGGWADNNTVPVKCVLAVTTGDFISRNGMQLTSTAIQPSITRVLRIAQGDSIKVLIGNVSNGGAAGSLTYTEALCFLTIDRVGN